VNLPAPGTGWCHDVDCPENLFGQPVVTERSVLADIHWLGDVGGDELLVGRVHGLLAGREWDNEVCSLEESVESMKSVRLLELGRTRGPLCTRSEDVLIFILSQQKEVT
jgi:hypothetical protein